MTAPRKRRTSAVRTENGAGPPAVPASADPLLSEERFALFGFGNDLTGMGLGGPDKAAYTRVFRRRPVPAEALEVIYDEMALARRIVDLPTEDAIREGFAFADLPKMVERRLEEIESALEDLEVLAALAHADRIARLYGGALLFLATDDGPAEQPLIPARVRSLSFEVIAAPDATITPDPSRGMRAYRDPESYTLYGSQRVHASRVIRFDGALVPDRLLPERQGWHVSELSGAYDSLRRLATVRSYMETLTHNISVSTLKIGGLGKAMLGSAEQKQRARRAVQELHHQVDNLHWLALDRDDSYDVSTRPIDGLQALEIRCVEAVVMDSGWPREVLTGETPGGLNTGSNSGAMRRWYGLVAARQRRVYTPALNRVLAVVFPLLGLAPKSWTIAWTPLWSEAPGDAANTARTLAQGDALYLSGGAVSPQQVRDWRAAQGLLPAGPAPGAPAPTVATPGPPDAEPSP